MVEVSNQTLFYFPTLVANNETQKHEPYSPYFWINCHITSLLQLCPSSGRHPLFLQLKQEATHPSIMPII